MPRRLAISAAVSGTGLSKGNSFGLGSISTEESSDLL